MASRAFGAVALLAGLAGCVGTRVADLGEYAEVEMKKVLPFPSDEERAQIAARVTIASQDGPEVDPVLVAPAHEQVRRRVDQVLATVGAEVVADGEGDDAPAEDFGTPAREYLLTARFVEYTYAAQWTKPFHWFWKSEEEMAQVPGTCTHRVDLAVDLDVAPADAPDQTVRTFSLNHSGEEETETVDQSCPFGQQALESLFGRTLDEALACVRVPLQNQFAARGSVLAHRHKVAGGGELYQTSLGSEYGAAESLEVGVFRVQHSTDPNGVHLRQEREIASGVVTDRVEAETSWIRVPTSDDSEEIMMGDVVRAVYREPRTSELNPFEGCSDILVRQ